MKKLKIFSTAALILGGIMLTMPFAGCGQKEYEDNENTVVIDFFKGDYGIDFINNLAEAFMEKNEGKTVYVKDTVLRNQIIDRLKSGPKSNDADIVMTNGAAYSTIGLGAQFGQPAIFEPLTEVYDYIAPGQTKSIRELTQKAFKDVTSFTIDGNTKEYFMIWSSGLQGLIYNKDLLSEDRLPKTTDELIALAGELKEELKGKNKSAFIYSGYVDYWTPLHLVWWAQYAGEEAYNKFYEGEIKQLNPFTGEEEYTQSPAIFTMPGREEALSVMETLLKNSNGYCDKNSTALSFTDAQRNFLKGQAAMHPNGDWLGTSIEKENAEVAFMKTPVISAIIDKLDTVKDDATLSKVIAYIDGDEGAELPSGVSEADLQTVTNARNMIYLASTTHFVGIPSYANAKPLAKEFLKFMYSEEGAMIFAKSTNGANLPINYDYLGNAEVAAKFSDFQKSRLALMNEDAIGIYQRPQHPLVYKGMLAPYSYNSGVLEAAFGATNENDRKTAADIIKIDTQKYDTTGWNNLLKLAGLK
jgi:hypothetical protein